MTIATELIRRLRNSRGDTRAQAAVAAEFTVLARSEAEREPLRAALDVVAILRWFDLSLLAAMLDLSAAEAERQFEALKHLPFIEPFGPSNLARSKMHEATRLGWRMRLAREEKAKFRALC